MGRYIGPVCRMCRRSGGKLFLKGEKCYTPRCPVTMRYDTSRKMVYLPGQHIMRRRKLSDYGTQLLEKQKLKRMYGLREKQFRTLYWKASSQRGNKEENLLILLEQRLDNVVFRSGFGTSRTQTRQLVRHGHFEVNGRRVTIPSYRVRNGDVVKVREKARNNTYFKTLLSKESVYEVPGWIEVNRENFWSKIVGKPQQQDIGLDIRVNLVVEYYSR